MAKCLRCGAGNEWIEGEARSPKTRDDGMPSSAPERHLRRLLAARVAMPGAYYDDGEAHGIEHGISIDFMREPVADIDAKLRALNVARTACAAAARPSNCARCKGAGITTVLRGGTPVAVSCEGCKPPND